MINIVRRHPIKEFTIVVTDNGILLCEKSKGAFLNLRYKEDIENLKELVDGLFNNPEEHKSINIHSSMEVNYSYTDTKEGE